MSSRKTSYLVERLPVEREDLEPPDDVPPARFFAAVDEVFVLELPLFAPLPTFEVDREAPLFAPPLLRAAVFEVLVDAPPLAPPVDEVLLEVVLLAPALAEVLLDAVLLARPFAAVDFAPFPEVTFAPFPEVAFAPFPEVAFAPFPEVAFAPFPEVAFAPFAAPVFPAEAERADEVFDVEPLTVVLAPPVFLDPAELDRALVEVFEREEPVLVPVDLLEEVLRVSVFVSPADPPLEVSPPLVIVSTAAPSAPTAAPAAAPLRISPAASITLSMTCDVAVVPLDSPSSFAPLGAAPFFDVCEFFCSGMLFPP